MKLAREPKKSVQCDNDLVDYEAVRLFLLQCEVVADRENLN